MERAKTDHMMEEFLQAVRHGDFILLRKLLSEKIELNRLDEIGCSPFFYAILRCPP